MKKGNWRIYYDFFTFICLAVERIISRSLVDRDFVGRVFHIIDFLYEMAF